MTLEEIKLKAFEIHEFKKCLYGGLSYSVHLNMAKEYYDKYIYYLNISVREDVEKAIWFHDVPEDTGESHNDIKSYIGDRAANYVYLVTNVYGRNRKEKLLNTLPKIGSTYESIYIKLCDRLANAKFSLSEKQKNIESSMYDIYVAEHPIVKYFLYKKGQFDDMWAELDDLFGYIDYNKINILEKEIKILILKRKEYLDTYYNSYDSDKKDYTIEEPKEIDEIGDKILKMLSDNKNILSIDFIVESLTHLGQAPNIIYDDNGYFAVTADAFQTVNVSNKPIDMNLSIHISKHQWKKNIREALIEYLSFDNNV